jgi:hypothetical protein
MSKPEDQKKMNRAILNKNKAKKGVKYAVVTKG